METMPSQGLISAPIPEQSKNRFGSDGSEEAIQACYDLLSSGHPLSEILVALKRLGPLNKVQCELRGARGDTQIFEIGGEFSDESSRWQIAKAAEPVESKRSLTAVHVPQFPEHAGDAERLSIKWSRPIGIALFWLIPAISLTVAGIAGKLLIDAHLLWQDAIAGAETMTSEPALSKITRTQPQIAPKQIEPARAAEVAVETASREEPAIQPVKTATINIKERVPLSIGNGGMPERPAAASPPSGSGHVSSAHHSQIYRAAPREWQLPRRLTDGF